MPRMIILLKARKGEIKPINRKALMLLSPKELEEAIDIEIEHTEDRRTAKSIVSHHLAESKDYYKELKKMEKKLKGGK